MKLENSDAYKNLIYEGSLIIVKKFFTFLFFF